MNFINFFLNDWKTIFPEIFLLLLSTILLIYGVIWNTSLSTKGHNILQNISYLGILGLFITIFLIVEFPLSSLTSFQNLIVIDWFGLSAKLIIIIASLFVLLISLEYFKTESIHAFEYTILILLAVSGLLLMVSSYDFIALYLAIEYQSLCLYVLASFKRSSEFSTEAGLKYFILGAFSSGLLLFGISLIYGITGSTNFESLHQLYNYSLNISSFYSTGIIIGLLFICVSLFFKLTVSPFHMWAPDVYEGSPTSVTAFFAIVPKMAILVVLTRLIFYVFPDFNNVWQLFFSICALLSIAIGSLGAIGQWKIKRLLAYSGIGHMGFLLISLSTNLVEGIQNSIMYLIIYIIMSLSIFIILLSIQNFENNYKLRYISDFQFIKQSYPILAFSISVIFFSMAGIPPLAGFMSKLYIFLSAIEASMFIVGIIGILLSVIGCFYYIRIVKLIYFEKNNTWFLTKPINYLNSLLLSICIFFLIFFFLYPDPILYFSYKAALSFVY
jgi:proton-translocating NADH-quinone oxidoreductase chain N